MTGETKKKKGECQICGKVVSKLARHMKIHNGLKAFKCELCAKEFAHSCSFTKHMRCHNGEKPFECNVCGKGFADSGDLTKHFRTHTGSMPF